MKFAFPRFSLRFIWIVLRCISWLFFGHLKSFYCCASAEYLAKKFFQHSRSDFARLLMLNKLMSKYIYYALHHKDWYQVDVFLQRYCNITDNVSSPGKLLFCTHTGDYWLSILTAARQFQGSDCDFVVPIYQKIDDDMLTMYKKIAIPGVNIMFVNIHENGALLKISRYLKRPGCVVALFYDLFTYSAGISNGSAEPVIFFSRKAWMTTGIINMAERMELAVNFMSCRYLADKGKYLINLTPTLVLSGKKDTRNLMLSFLETYLRETPWQWHFIASLDAYYHVPLFALQAKNSREAEHFARLNYKYSHYTA